jgi:hypothetical protein
MPWYDMYQFCLLNKKVSMLGISDNLNESFYISKSFYVLEFGKLAVSSTPAESSFFKPLHC